MGLGFLILTVIGFLKKLGCGLAPSDEGAVEQSETEGEKGCGFMRFYFSPSVFLLTQKATSLVRGRR